MAQRMTDLSQVFEPTGRVQLARLPGPHRALAPIRPGG